MNPPLLLGVILCFFHLGQTSQNEGDMYQELEDGEVCSSQTDIKTEAECREAALELGLEYHSSWPGHGDHPGCLHAVEHGHGPFVDKVFFNTSPNPSSTTYTGYFSICKKSTSQESFLAIDGSNGITELLNTSCNFALPERRKAPISVTTADGKTLVCGGASPRNGGSSKICWQFDYRSKSWRQPTNYRLSKERVTASAVSLASGTYVLGGSKQSSKNSEFLTTGSSMWTRGPDIPGSGVFQSCAAKLNDTAFVVLGGWYDGYQARVYNEDTGMWTNWPNLEEWVARQSCAAVGDTVVMAGGYTNGREYTARTVVFDSRDGSVLKVGSLIHPRGLAGIGFIGGNVVILGGYDGSVKRKDGEMWNTDTKEWEIADISLKSPRHYLYLVKLVEEVECN